MQSICVDGPTSKSSQNGCSTYPETAHFSLETRVRNFQMGTSRCALPTLYRTSRVEDPVQGLAVQCQSWIVELSSLGWARQIGHALGVTQGIINCSFMSAIYPTRHAMEELILFPGPRTRQDLLLA